MLSCLLILLLRCLYLLIVENSVGDWRIKREESYDDDEAVEEIENSMGGCCCGSAKGAADQFNNAPSFYYVSSISSPCLSFVFV